MPLCEMRMTVCGEGMAFKYWKNCLKHRWIFRVPLLSCWLGWWEVQPLFSLVSLSSSVSPLSQMMSVSRTQRITFAPRLPMASGPRSFDENSRKAVKEEKIKSAALSALVSADPPWESLWDHNTSHKTAGARPACLKRTCLSVERGCTELESGGKRKVSRIHRLNEGFSGQAYRIGAGMVEWEVVCGDWRRRGGLLVIIWSLSTTPAPHSPTPEGSRPCCVYHRPPMDSLKSDRNKRQDCALLLPRIYLRLTLLTSALHVSQRNKLYSWLSLYVFIIKCYIKMLTNLEKKESCLYASVYYKV